MAGVQIIGALIVAAGVCLAAAPSDAGANIFQQVCMQAFVFSTHEECEVIFMHCQARHQALSLPTALMPALAVHAVFDLLCLYIQIVCILKAFAKRKCLGVSPADSTM